MTSKSSEKPNFVVILTDDQGWGDLSIHGNTQLSTPNIDKLARDGAQFDRFYVSPVCSPTRSEFLTGRDHARSGVYSTSAGGERVNPDEQMIGEFFQSAGYKTAAFGKWHSGMQFPYHPNARGFEEFYGFCSGHWGNYFDPMLEHNGQLVKGKGFIIDDLTNRAMDYIEKHQESPFFVYLPYNTPHSPMQVPERWWNKFKDKELNQKHPFRDRENIIHSRAALAMCENIDWNVGRLIKKLDELKLSENTVVIYFCDNGPNGSRWNGGMKGRKGSTDEGGVRSPLFVKWPSKIKSGIDIPHISSAKDLLPTLLDIAEVNYSPKNTIDGISLKPLLLGQATDWPDRMLVQHWRGRVSVRSQKYRLDYQGKLYDMMKDPGQTRDIQSNHPKLTAKYKKIAESFRAEMLSTYGKEFDKRPFIIGHPDSKLTQIPARDGIPHGNIKRSNRFPNDSFFFNWTDLDDSITWDCEVGKSGLYKVEIFYTCPEDSVGSEVQLSFKNQKMVGKITKAHNPPLAGMEHDRFKRVESYVKDFKRITLGTIRLNKGKGELKLNALTIPGSQVMDFRLMLLTRE